MEKQDIFSTRDLYLAAVLVTMKFEISGVDFQIEGGKQLPVGYFSFKNSQDLNRAETKYWSGQLAVEPRAFVNNLRGLKAMVAGIYKGPHTDMSKFKVKE